MKGSDVSKVLNCKWNNRPGNDFRVLSGGVNVAFLIIRLNADLIGLFSRLNETNVPQTSRINFG